MVCINNSRNSAEHMSPPFAIDDEVQVVGGTHRNKSGTVVKLLPKSVKIALNGDDRKTILMKFVKTTQQIEAETVLDFRLPDYDKGGMEFGSRAVTRLFGENMDNTQGNTFLSHITGSRTVAFQIPMNKIEAEKGADKVIDHHSSKFELISRKVVETDRGGLFSRAKDIEYIYMQTEGEGLTAISPAKYLSRIGDFSSLTTRKVVARLELFQSPAYKCKSTGEFMLKFFDHREFGDIDEKGHVGCGFICEKLLVEILGNTKFAERAICIQIRAFVPMKGVYKGMLMKKRITEGPKILLPESMKKIPASKDPLSEKGCLLVTQAGVDPSSTNNYMGRLPSIDPDANNPPPQSFCPKECSEMILRLLKSLKVPKEVASKYAQESVRKRGRKDAPLPSIMHSFLRGVADPTGKIPPNHVFLTGVRNDDLLGDSLFITRSPCIKASDGHLIKVLTSKPDSMADEEYEWLNNLSFGAVIFGFSKEGMLSTAERIAQGDLDGDRYFVCWSKDILQHLEADPLEDIPMEAPKEKTTKADTGIGNGDVDSTSAGTRVIMEDDWFEKAQAFMADSELSEISELIGKLYTANGKAADADGERFMRNPDAIAFADAFYQALENGKHGTKVVLPEHLWEKIPKALHKHLTAASPVHVKYNVNE